MSSVPSAVRLAVEWHREHRPEPLAVLYLPFDPGPHGANRQRGRHWGQRTSQDDDPARLAALWAHSQAGGPVLEQPAEVEVLVLRRREMDDDNILAALKPARDWLCRKWPDGRARLLPDDTPAWWLYRGVRQVTSQAAFPQGWTVLFFYSR